MQNQRLMAAMYFILGIISAGVGYSLSLKMEKGIPFMGEGAGGGVDIAADGGALGFALLGGICFACSTYLIKKDK